MHGWADEEGLWRSRCACTGCSGVRRSSGSSTGSWRCTCPVGTDPPRWIAWRERDGTAYSASLWSPAWSGEPDHFVAGGLLIRLAALTFGGYRRPPGAAPAPYRGVHTNGTPPGTPAVTEVEYARVPIADPPPGTPPLPPALAVPLIRTDFSDDTAWTEASTAVQADRHLSTGDVFSADVELVDDRRYDGLAAGQVIRLVPPGAGWDLLFVADATTMTSPERTVLVIDLDEEGLGRTFRATPPAVQEIENNLSLSNMDWEDFAGSADPDGIVRPMID